MKKRIIVDVDTGLDDALGLIILMQAEKLGLIEIHAITCVVGNTTMQNVLKNVVRLLELSQRTDIPVYKGVTTPLLPMEINEHFFGEDGFGDLQHQKEPDLSIIKETPAPVAIQDIINKYPNQITVVCLGPLTNLALSMKLYDDLGTKIKDIFIMGGNYNSDGNVRTKIEFNFRVDPEAAFIVLNTARCPITILPWETCTNTMITFDWRFNVMAKLRHPCMNILNKADLKCYVKPEVDYGYAACDAFLTIIILHPEEFIKSQDSYNATIELCGTERGLLILQDINNKKPTVNLIKSISADHFQKAVMQILGSYTV